jgi:argininosuccinate synthase
MNRPLCVLAFSGGLDTSYCCAWISRELGYDVMTVVVNTGGFDAADLQIIAKRSREVGAVKHLAVDAAPLFFDSILVYLIRANVLRGGVYPLSASAERAIQGREVCRVAKEHGASAIAHGSTGAGNDQFRFDTAIGVLAPNCKLLTPIRDHDLTREATTLYLRTLGIAVPDITATYSLNKGLWGTTIGGGETHDSWSPLSEEAYTFTVPLVNTPDVPEELIIGFEQGIPLSLNGQRLPGVELVTRLGEVGGRHGVGRGMHVGTTLIGIKGRVAFEAPAPLILIAAHRELEKLVQTRTQAHLSVLLGESYGTALHEGRYFEPAMRDIEAFFDSTQKKVTGDVRVRLFKGQATVIGVRSPYSMLGKGAKYGERAHLFDGRDGRGFCKVSALEIIVAVGEDP